MTNKSINMRGYEMLDVNKEVQNLKDAQKQILNSGMFYMNELLTRLGRYKKRQLRNDEYLYDKSPYQFCLHQNDTQETWLFEFCGCSIDEQNFVISVWRCNPKEDEPEMFLYEFRYKEFNSQFTRKMMSSWIMGDTFKKVWGEEEVEQFIKRESIYRKEHNFMLYE